MAVARTSSRARVATSTRACATHSPSCHVFFFFNNNVFLRVRVLCVVCVVWSGVHCHAALAHLAQSLGVFSVVTVVSAAVVDGDAPSTPVGEEVEGEAVAAEGEVVEAEPEDTSKTLSEYQAALAEKRVVRCPRIAAHPLACRPLPPACLPTPSRLPACLWLLHARRAQHFVVGGRTLHPRV